MDPKHSLQLWLHSHGEEEEWHKVASGPSGPLRTLRSPHDLQVTSGPPLRTLRSPQDPQVTSHTSGFWCCIPSYACDVCCAVNQMQKADTCFENFIKSLNKFEDVPLVEFMYLVFTRIWGKSYLWWSLCTLHLHVYQVKVTVGDSGLCCLLVLRIWSAN